MKYDQMSLLMKYLRSFEWKRNLIVFYLNLINKLLIRVIYITDESVIWKPAHELCTIDCIRNLTGNQYN